MPSTDENIEAAVVTMINTALSISTCEGRKKPGMREGDTARIFVACAYAEEDAGHNETGHERQVFYKLYVFFMTRSSLGSSGDETINARRQAVAKLLARPAALAAVVTVVDDIYPTRVPQAAYPPQPEGVDIQALGFDVETYESLV